MSIIAQWQHQFIAMVEWLSPHANAEIQRFWVLFISGKAYGEGSWVWLRSFRHLYILHLLVLSGSQVESLSRLVRTLFNGICGYMGFQGLAATRARALRGLLSVVLVAFAAATQWSAPITRATLIGLISLWALRWTPGKILVTAFLLQWFVFPGHRHEMGFYLSWIAYLVVVLMGHFRVGAHLSTAVVSLILFLVVDTGFFGNPFRLESLALCLAANVLFCSVFSFAFMPLAAVFILWAMILSVGRVLGASDFGWSGDFLALWTEPMAQALLVVLRWLMYT